MKKTMQFIIEQQAQFAADIQRLRESHQKLAESHQRLTEGQQRLTESQAKLAEAALANTGMIGRIMNILDRLAQAQTQLAEAQARTDAKVAEMAERLDAFIVTVERYITERRNGKREG